jgi:N-acetylmuramoyl-L-alanine amidase
MRFLPSPNFNDRAAGKSIQHLILHYTGMPTAQAAIERLCDPAAQVSAHYVVDTDGAVTQLVDENKRAWHAGVSFWAGETDLNSTSIGIEIVNPGHEFGYVSFPSAQIDAVIRLCREIVLRHAIPPHHVLAHSDIAPTRKMDPGELFPWKRLAERGIGIFPFSLQGEGGAQRRMRGTGGSSEFLECGDTSPPPHPPFGHLLPAGRRELGEYGYDITNLPAAITAFQRHFRSEKITDEWDDECSARLAWLLQNKSFLPLEGRGKHPIIHTSQ